MNIISLNKSNVVDDSYNNRLIYKLNKQLEANKYKVSLFSVSIPYSIPNISTIYNNNTFQIKYNNITYDYTINEGFYDTNSLNNYFKYIQKNNTALPYNVINNIDVFFFGIVENATYYSTQLALTKTLLNGIAGHNSAVYNNKTFQVKFNSNLADFLGFKKDVFYPLNEQSTDYLVLSKDENLVPNLTPVFSISVNCNLITNEFSNNSSTIYTYVPLNITFGSLFSFIVNPPLFFNSTQQTDRIIITLTDQDNRSIKFLDNNLTINLLIEPY
jgi:hypothetical protein